MYIEDLLFSKNKDEFYNKFMSIYHTLLKKQFLVLP